MGGLSDVIESSGIIGKVLESGAPILASVLGSPVAGIAVGLIAHLFGANKSSISDVMEKIGIDPDAATKLKQLEIEHKDELVRMANADYSLQVQDVEDARKYGATDRVFMKLLAMMVTFGFFCVLVALFFPLNIQPDAKNLLLLLIGNLSSKWQTIIDYFYGSSRPQLPSQGGLK